MSEFRTCRRRLRSMSFLDPSEIQLCEYIFRKRLMKKHQQNILQQRQGQNGQATSSGTSPSWHPIFGHSRQTKQKQKKINYARLKSWFALHQHGPPWGSAVTCSSLLPLLPLKNVALPALFITLISMKTEKGKIIKTPHILLTMSTYSGNFLEYLGGG